MADEDEPEVTNGAPRMTVSWVSNLEINPVNKSPRLTQTMLYGLDADAIDVFGLH